MRLILMDTDVMRVDGSRWLGAAAVAAMFALGLSQGLQRPVAEVAAPAATVLRPVPEEQTLDVRTLVLPEIIAPHSNAHPRRDI
jgi:hypothetical protein